MTDYKPFTIKLAGKKIRITPMHGMIREYCKEYIVPDSAYEDKKCVNNTGHDTLSVDLIVTISPEDIAYERMRSERNALPDGRDNVVYPDDYLETLAVYRKISEWMPSQGIILFHGSVIAVDGKAYLFTAKSGTGKSTHTKLWREYFGERAVMINDDKPLIRVSQDGVYVYGTPWDGKHRLSTNTHAPLAGICILRRGSENVIRKITAHEAYPMLMQQCYRPMDRDSLMDTMLILDRLKEKISFHELYCNISQEAVEVAYNGMKR